MQVTKKNLILAEFKTLLSPITIGFFIYSIAISLLSTYFSLQGVSKMQGPAATKYVTTVISTLMIFHLFMGVFLSTFERVAPDRSKLAFHLYNKSFVTKVKWSVNLAGYLIRAFISIALLLILFSATYAHNLAPGASIDYGIVISAMFKSLVPIIAVQSILYIGSNYVQSLTTDEGLARFFLFIFSIVIVGPILGVSYAMTTANVQSFFDQTWVKIVFRIVPPLSMLSPLFGGDSYWWVSFVFWFEIIILTRTFLWEKYSIGQKKFYISIES